jgi:hypothetical protein
VSLDSIRSSWYKSWCKSASSNRRKAAIIESAVAFDLLPEHVSFLAGPSITTLDNLSSHCRVHRNRLQPPRTQGIQATAEELINPIDNIISRCRAPRDRLQTPRPQATQATAAEPTPSTVRTSSSLRALRNRFQQARTQLTTNSTDTWRFFPGRNSPS